MQLWMVFHIREIRTYIAALEKSISEIKSRNRKFSISFKPGYLEKMRSSLDQAVERAAEKGRGASGDSSLESGLFRMDERLAVYNTAAAVYYRASGLYSLDPVTKLVSEDEILYKQAQTYFDELKRADGSTDPDTIQTSLRQVYRTFPEFCTGTEKLQKRNKQVGTAEKAVLLVLAAGAIAGITVVTAGAASAPAAALLSGGTGGIMTGLTTSQAVIVMTAESYAWTTATEALAAITEDRNLSFINITSGFITNLMLEGIFRYINMRFIIKNTAPGDVDSLSKAVLFPLKKAAALAAGSFIGSIPGFIFRTGMTYQRLPDLQTWRNFLIADAIASSVFSTISASVEYAPQIVQQIKKSALKGRMVQELKDIRSNLEKAEQQYEKVTEKYGKIAVFDQKAYNELVTDNKTVIENLQLINKSLKGFRRLLIEVQVQYSINELKVLTVKYASLQAIDDLLDGIVKLLDKTVFRNPPRYGLAVEIGKLMGSGKGLLPLDASKGLYLGRNELLLVRQKDIEGLLTNYKVEIGYKIYEGQIERSKGTLLMTIRDLSSGELVDSVTSLDIAGRGAAELALRVPRLTGNRESTLPPDMLHVVTVYSEYMDLRKKGAKAILAAVKAHDRNTVLANMSEEEEVHLRDLLRSYHIDPIMTGRIESGNWPFSHPSGTFVFDMIQLINIRSRKIAIIKIGYGLKAILEMDMTPQPIKYLRIFVLDENATCLLPAVTDSLKKEFLDMVRRAKYIKKGGPHDPGFKCADKFSYGRIDGFRDWYDKMSDLLRKKYGRLSDDEVNDRIKDLIDKVNTRPFTDTWSPYSYCVDSLSDPEKPDRIQAMENKYTENELKYNEEYQVLKMCNDSLSAYGQFANNGYTITALGKPGVGEYFLSTEYDEKKPALKQNGYTEIGLELLSDYIPEE
jgi:hypothetical protein